MNRRAIIRRTDCVAAFCEAKWLPRRRTLHLGKRLDASVFDD